MEVKQIKDLMQAMRRTGICRLRVKREGVEVELELEENGKSKLAEQVLEFVEENPMRHDIEHHRARAFSKNAAKFQTHTEEEPQKVQKEEKDDANSFYVTSPLVGTFYPQSSPEDSPFVAVGQKVDSDTVVCIIEAMKVMNEVKAGVQGVISEILIEAGQPIEYGTKLFRIKKQ